MPALIEGGSYANGGWWSKHVQSTEKNESVELMQAEGFSGNTVDEFFPEMKAVSLGTKCTNYFYQYNINIPNHEHLTDEQWEQAHAIVRKNHGMENHAWFRVRHVKIGDDGIPRLHEHGFISRIDPDRMRAHSDSLSAQIREQCSREIEQTFGLSPGRSVLVADRDFERPERRPKKWEQFRGAQHEIDPKDITRELTAIKQRSDNGQSFRAGIEAAGYILARGDKRDFVILDQRGDDHSVARRLHIKTAELRKFMKDVDPATLPSVEQARSRQRIRATGEARQRHEALTPFTPLEQTSTLSDGRARAPERPLNRTQGDLRLAFGLSRSPEELQQALAGRHIGFARVSAGEARASRDHAKLYREQQKQQDRPASPSPLSRAQEELDRLTQAKENGVWMLATGGVDGFTAAQLESAKASYGSWVEKRREQQPDREPFSFAPYVDYVQKQQRQELEKLKLAAAMPAPEPTAATPPQPKERLRDAPTLKQGEIVAVDGRGQVYRLDRRTTALDRGEIDKRLAGIDAGSLMNIADAKAAMIEQRRATVEQERAQARIDAPLGKTAGDIRTAWTLSRSQEELHAALAGRGFGIARVTADEARASGGLHEHQQRQFEQAKVATAAGAYAALKIEPQRPRAQVFQEGELVAVNRFGSVYRFDERTTGQLRGEIDKRLAGIDTASLSGVADTTAGLREISKAVWRDAQEKKRPATAIEQKIIDCREQARAQGATVRQNRRGEIVSRVDALADRLRPAKERQTHSATIHGDRAFAARLDHAGIAIVRVTADDVKALDQLRSDEQRDRLAAGVNGVARRSQSFANVKEGDLAAVTRAGNVFRLNPHRIDVAGIESAISSTVATAKLPGVTEARAGFESERGKIDQIREQRRVDSHTRRAQREQSAARGRTMRGAESATLKAGATADRTTKAAGKGFGIIGGIFAGLFKFFDPFPAKPPSPEQQERNYWAAKEQQATDQINRRKKITGDELRAQMARDDQERARQRRERGRDIDDYGRDR